MKILLSIFMLVFGLSAYGQINKRTLVQRERYAKESTLQLKQSAVPISLQKSFLYGGKRGSGNPISIENYLKHSSALLQKGFDYYHSGQKQSDYSAFLLLGYSIPTNQQIIVNNREDESVRFFPANIKD